MNNANTLNLTALENPQAGDIWYVGDYPVSAIVKVEKDAVFTVDSLSESEFDFRNTTRMSHGALKVRVTIEDQDEFLANVVRDPSSFEVVETWKDFHKNRLYSEMKFYE